MKINKSRRLLQLLMLLSGKRYYSMDELVNKFEYSERSLYRDLDEIEAAGFLLERNNGKYRLQTNPSETKTLQRLFHFTEEEAAVLYETLNMMGETSEVKSRLVRKLHTFYDLKVLESLKKKDDINKTQQIAESIRKKKQLTLKNYQSSNSNEVRDRRVEPFEFSPNYHAVWALDLGDRICKQFKVSRIEEVELLESSWHNENLHKRPFTDVFRMAASEPIDTLTLGLNLRACNLLKEEYPSSTEYISGDDNAFTLQCKIADYKGVGRFVLGLLPDIQIIESPKFKKYIQAEIQKYHQLIK